MDKNNKILLIIVIILVIISATFFVFYILSYCISSWKCYFGDFFYYCTIAVATISLCVLPIHIYFRDKRIRDIEDNKRIIKEKLDADEKKKANLNLTIKQISDVADFINKDCYIFVMAVVTSFNDTYGLTDLVGKFDSFDNNDLYCDAVQDTIVKKNKKEHIGEFKSVLLKSIKANYYLLNMKDERIDTDHKCFELFYHKLVEVGNKFEQFALEVLNNSDLVVPKMYIKEVFGVINNFYTNSYYIMFQLYITDSLDQLDSFWSTMNKENKIINE